MVINNELKSMNDNEKLDFPKGRGYSTRFVVYVPSTEKDKPIPTFEFNQRISETEKFLSDTFGGSTRVSGEGAWTENGEVIKERVAKVEAFTPTKKYLKEDKILEKWLKKKAKEWNQYALSFEYESPTHRSSRMYFVRGEEKLKEVV